MQLKKAQRKQVKMRLSLSAPTGFGKTTSALLIAYGMTGDWDKIAVIDTENGSSQFYANHKVPGTDITIGEFNTIEMGVPFTPERYTEAIHACEDAGMEVIIIDSVTHVWKGEGGLLEANNKLGGRYQDWAKTTPRYQQWLNSILFSKCHVLTTSRKKQAYNMVQDGNRTKVEKQGMEDEIRDGYDYEMTIAFDLINDKHLANASKDRSGLFMNTPEFVITADTGKKILQWCNSGAEPEQRNITAEIAACADTISLKALFNGLSKDQQEQYRDAANHRREQLSPPVNA